MRGTFTVTTDASNLAIGAVLTQEQDGLQKVVAYESRKLNSAECGYAPHDREGLALIHALTTWRHYLQNGNTHVVYTDNSAITHLLTQPRLNP
jgi:hypothetical protein